MKAPRNRTIDISVEEGQPYLDRCIRVERPAALGSVLDRTILGDALRVPTGQRIVDDEGAHDGLLSMCWMQ